MKKNIFPFLLTLAFILPVGQVSAQETDSWITRKVKEQLAEINRAAQYTIFETVYKSTQKKEKFDFDRDHKLGYAPWDQTGPGEYETVSLSKIVDDKRGLVYGPGLEHLKGMVYKEGDRAGQPRIPEYEREGQGLDKVTDTATGLLGLKDFGEFYFERGLEAYSRPPISADVNEFVTSIFPASLTKLSSNLKPPVVPSEILSAYKKGNKGDYISQLSVDGPFAELVSYNSSTGEFEIDFDGLKNYPVHPNLRSLGSKGYFTVENGKLKVTKIEYYDGDLKSGLKKVVAVPGSGNWLKAQRAHSMSMTSYVTLAQHLAETHLVVGQNISDSLLYLKKHPLGAFLSTFANKTKTVNANVGRLVATDQDAVHNFSSVPHDVARKILNDYVSPQGPFDIAAINPYKSAKRRNLLTEEGKPVKNFHYPYLKDATALYDIIHSHALQILEAIYGAQDQAESNQRLANDPQIQEWLAYLEQTVPKGISSVVKGPVTLSQVAELMAIFMYNGTVRHEVVGNQTWDIATVHPIIPTRMNMARTDCDERQDLTSSMRYLLTSLVTMVEMRKFFDDPIVGNLAQKDLVSVQNPHFRPSENPETIRVELQNVVKDMFRQLREYEKTIPQERKNHPFQLAPSKLEGSVAI